MRGNGSCRHNFLVLSPSVNPPLPPSHSLPPSPPSMAGLPRWVMYRSTQRLQLPPIHNLCLAISATCFLWCFYALLPVHFAPIAGLPQAYSFDKFSVMFAIMLFWCSSVCTVISFTSCCHCRIVSIRDCRCPVQSYNVACHTLAIR